MTGGQIETSFRKSAGAAPVAPPERLRDPPGNHPLPAGAQGPLSLSLVDDRTILREGLRSLLERQPGLHGRDPAASQDPHRAVTSRERQVLTRIASGHSNKTVARELNLRVRMIKQHRARLMRKLGPHNAAAILRSSGIRRG